MYFQFIKEYLKKTEKEGKGKSTLILLLRHNHY